jgi:hypothetical protein
MLLTQIHVTLHTTAGTFAFNTFSIDLSHTASIGQTYDVNPRSDLSTAFANGSRMAYIYQTYGVGDLSGNADQAAAVSIALWDLSLSNHNPTSLTQGADGSYSSGDPDIFKVSLGSNPDKAQIAQLANQYLSASSVISGGAWLDAAVPGAGPNHGPSVIRPVPEPSSISLCLVAAGCLSVWGLWRRRAAESAERTAAVA